MLSRIATPLRQCSGAFFLHNIPKRLFNSHIPYKQRQWTAEELKYLKHVGKLPGFTIHRKNPIILTKHFVWGPGTHAPNSRFDYEWFVNKESKQLKGLVHFGTHVEGPDGYVHGGAIATVIDTVMAACIWNVGLKFVTVNLNVNYRKFIPLDTTVIAEAYVEKLEKRKVFVRSVLKSLDEKVIHNEGSGVFFQVLLPTEKNTP